MLAPEAEAFRLPSRKQSQRITLGSDMFRRIALARLKVITGAHGTRPSTTLRMVPVLRLRGRGSGIYPRSLPSTAFAVASAVMPKCL